MITEKIEKLSQIKAWPGKIPLHNVYTVGVANERFLRAIKKEGKLLASLCQSCQCEFLPPKMFCPFCLKELKQWKEVSAVGQVETFTISHLDPLGSPLPQAVVFAFVRLTRNGGLIHRLGEISPEKVKIGLKVEAVFKPAPERTGSILDIEYFRPVQ